jgi:hypothetical protein
LLSNLLFYNKQRLVEYISRRPFSLAKMLQFIESNGFFFPAGIAAEHMKNKTAAFGDGEVVAAIETFCRVFLSHVLPAFRNG